MGPLVTSNPPFVPIAISLPRNRKAFLVELGGSRTIPGELLESKKQEFSSLISFKNNF